MIWVFLADFEDKYYELCRLGAGGYGYVYDGLRKSDNFPVGNAFTHT